VFFLIHSFFCFLDISVPAYFGFIWFNQKPKPNSWLTEVLIFWICTSILVAMIENLSTNWKFD
jgi:hypothetical protein